jgi:hypothetical protein
MCPRPDAIATTQILRQDSVQHSYDQARSNHARDIHSLAALFELMMHRIPFLIAKSLRDITVHKALSKHIDPTVTEPTSTEKGGNKASVICKIQYCDGKCARRCLAIDRPVGEAPLIALITTERPSNAGQSSTSNLSCPGTSRLQ